MDRVTDPLLVRGQGKHLVSQHRSLYDIADILNSNLGVIAQAHLPTGLTEVPSVLPTGHSTTTDAEMPS